MSDLISRQDALKPFCIAPDGTRIPEVDCDNFPVEVSVQFIKKHLLSLPSADAVEVVRCKDCKYWKEGMNDLISRAAVLSELNEAYDLIDAEHRIKELDVPDINVGSKNCILDKIRGEIESCREVEEPHLCDYRYYINVGLDMALDIIDKYNLD